MNPILENRLATNITNRLDGLTNLNRKPAVPTTSAPLTVLRNPNFFVKIGTTAINTIVDTFANASTD